MTPGAHTIVLGGCSDALAARRRGLQLRDTILVMGPGGLVRLAVLLRAPLDGNVAHNVMVHGKGALDIEACRIATTDNLGGGAYCGTGDRNTVFGIGNSGREFRPPSGRWPTNMIIAHGSGCHRAGDTWECSLECPMPGSVSRFYPQFGTDVEMLDWLVRLVGQDGDAPESARVLGR